MLGLPPLGGLVCSSLPQPRQGHHVGQVCSGHGAAAAQLDVPASQEATRATKPPCRVSCLDTGAMPSSHSTSFPARQTFPFGTTFSLGSKMRSHLEPDDQRQVDGSGEGDWA